GSCSPNPIVIRDTLKMYFKTTSVLPAVAIKISKSDPSFLQQARREIAILKQLQCLDPDTCNIVRWNGYFFHKDHICLSFELLDQSLFAYMKERNNFGLPVMELRPIIYQINMALGHLKSKGIAHTDLKPDNVMVVDRHQKPLRVKLIDFGLACPASELTPGFIAQSLWYRAPEVMLHIPYNEAIDMWSLGLIAAELATGYPLYPGNMPYDVLNFIIETQGLPGDYVINATVIRQFSLSLFSSLSYLPLFLPTFPLSPISVLSPQPVVADGRPQLSPVLLQISSC
uniref:Protein kinase domain-containing protein n=1 Tax=Scophthalmus maximus TaxID=52904 RepID=A0A8D3BVH4_SCOMX